MPDFVLCSSLSPFFVAADSTGSLCFVYALKLLVEERQIGRHAESIRFRVLDHVLRIQERRNAQRVFRYLECLFGEYIKLEYERE